VPPGVPIAPPRSSSALPGTARFAPAPARELRDRLGLCQWFHHRDEPTLARAVRWLRELGVRHLRTGISWADYHLPGAPAWYDRVFSALAEFEVLVSVWHTPPSLSIDGRCASPPRRLRDYADFIDLVITRHGGGFSHLELWNEPDNLYKWDFARHDPDWAKFGAMIGDAAYWARSSGVPTVLGGMIPVDPHWLLRIARAGALPHLEKIAIHGLPGMWWPSHANWDWHGHWRGWAEKLERLAPIAGDRAIWITETGLATWDPERDRPARHTLQAEMLDLAAAAPVERVYWYSLLDLDPAREAIEGFHVDENEYHLGLITHADRPKPAFHRFQALLARRVAALPPRFSPGPFPGPDGHPA
jgi:CDP-paratose 2-epimerase